MSMVTQPTRAGLVTTSPVQSRSTNDGNPKTPLREVTSNSGFVFPAIWSFPPFFTLQPNPSTLAHQLTLWTALVLRWAKHNRVFMINTDDQDGPEVFNHKAIKRRLQQPAVKQVLAELVKKGDAVADPPKQTSTYLLYWRKPEEWGALIHEWVMDNGFGSSIMTFYEITEGDLSDKTEFYQLPAPLLRKALDTLVKRGKAQIIKGDGEMGEGARFF